MSKNFKVSAAGLEAIVEHEGEILHVYADPVGLPTLGVGHLLTPSERRAMPLGTKITKDESRAFLRKDLARFEQCVNDAVKVDLNQNQFDALVSLAFNIGEANFERSSVLRFTNQRNYSDAANAFLKWNKARVDGVLVALPGLTTRRKKERTLYLRPRIKTPVPSSDSSKEGISVDQPDSVSGGVQGSPGPVAAPPPVSTDKGLAGSIGETASAVADAATSWLNKAGNIQEGVRRASFLSRFGKAFLAALSLITTFLVANWEIFLLALLITAAVVGYLLVVRPKRLGGSGTE